MLDVHLYIFVLHILVVIWYIFMCLLYVPVCIIKFFATIDYLYVCACWVDTWHLPDVVHIFGVSDVLTYVWPKTCTSLSSIGTTVLRCYCTTLIYCTKRPKVASREDICLFDYLAPLNITYTHEDKIPLMITFTPICFECVEHQYSLSCKPLPLQPQHT